MTCPTTSASALMKEYAVAIGSMFLPRSALCTVVADFLMGHMLSFWPHKDHSEAHLDLFALLCAITPGTKDAKSCGHGHKGAA